jgi:hypothetical protein
VGVTDESAKLPSQAELRQPASALSSASPLPTGTPPPAPVGGEGAVAGATAPGGQQSQALAPGDLKTLLLPEDWTIEQLEKEARRIYFDDLVQRPPVTPAYHWLEDRTIIINDSEGGFWKIFGRTKGWATFQHKKTGELDRERLRRASWIRPILEMRAPKTKIYVNNHSMKPREFGPRQRQEKKRIFITLGKDVLYFISLVYTDHGLALGTAFAPDGEWLREMQRKSMLLGPA